MQMTLEEAIGYVASDELIEASFVFSSNIYLVQKIYLILFCEDRAVFAKGDKQLILLDYESLFHFLYH
jgi:hypothetical protein